MITPAAPLLARVAMPDGGARWAIRLGEAIHRLANAALESAPAHAIIAAAAGDLARLVGEPLPVPAGGQAPRLLAPLDRGEVWAAGVTYERSRQARVEEAEIPDIYARVYTAERPELFFKATAARVVGPGAPIGVRREARWTVPEPELALVLDPDLRIVGCTIGNDVTARDLEAANPLYLPQAKVYPGSCALGPGVAAAVDPAAIPDLGIGCTIGRSGAILWEASTSSGRLVRSWPDLARFLAGCGPFPDGAVLLTGTGVVPPDDVSLAPGDVVRVEIEGIGVLENPVVAVG